MSRSQDPVIEQIKLDLMKEFDISKNQIDSVVSHFFLWQFYAFSDAKYAAYYWNKFGTFTFFNRPHSKIYFKQADEYFNSTRKLDKTKKEIKKENYTREQYIKDQEEKDNTNNKTKNN
jgi:hypothetical protein